MSRYMRGNVLDNLRAFCSYGSGEGRSEDRVVYKRVLPNSMWR